MQGCFRCKAGNSAFPNCPFVQLSLLTTARSGQDRAGQDLRLISNRASQVYGCGCGCGCFAGQWTVDGWVCGWIATAWEKEWKSLCTSKQYGCLSRRQSRAAYPGCSDRLDWIGLKCIVCVQAQLNAVRWIMNNEGKCCCVISLVAQSDKKAFACSCMPSHAGDNIQ